MKKYLYVTFLFLALICAYEIIETYALLEGKGNAIVTPRIGKWEITINDFDIAVEKEITASDLVYVGNQYTELGYFAPGTSASYDIIIDPNNTDVAIRYDIAIDVEDLEKHPNIVFSIGGDATRVDTDEGISFAGVIPLVDVKSGEKTTITINLIWENDPDYDELDTTLSEKDATLDIKFSAKFSQYTGEDL